MSHLYECNRCHEKTAEAMNELRLFDDNGSTFSGSTCDDHIHLCSKCVEALEAWLGGLTPSVERAVDLFLGECAQAPPCAAALRELAAQIIAEAAADVARLDGRTITLTIRDDYGDDRPTTFLDVDLRAAIDRATAERSAARAAKTEG